MVENVSIYWIIVVCGEFFPGAAACLWNSCITTSFNLSGYHWDKTSLWEKEHLIFNILFISNKMLPPGTNGNSSLPYVYTVCIAAEENQPEVSHAITS